MLRIAPAALGLALLGACATDSPAPIVQGGAATDVPPASQVELAMGTVDALVEAGNTQTAIYRLTDLLGRPELSSEEAAAALYRRGELRLSASGYDTYGAINDFDEITAKHTETSWVDEAMAALETARGKATSLNFMAEQPGASRSDRFSAHFALGEHEDAIDIMLAGGVTPTNDQLVAMYQIGYLCEGDEYTGPAYAATEPDGTARTLRFCDFGK
ncbi:MAG: hypothetical protein AAFX03_13350 [Pseudomonadota bacterium]